MSGWLLVLLGLVLSLAGLDGRTGFCDFTPLLLFKPFSFVLDFFLEGKFIIVPIPIPIPICLLLELTLREGRKEWGEADLRESLDEKSR